jgi:uncharacterized protein (DUF983 family)
MVKNCCCPVCGEGSIFCNFLKIKNNCNYCKQKLSDHDSGDGPMFFAMLILNIFIVLLAIVIEIKFKPPIWLHISIWGPLIIILSLILIRYLKVLFLFLHFKYRRK